MSSKTHFTNLTDYHIRQNQRNAGPPISRSTPDNTDRQPHRTQEHALPGNALRFVAGHLPEEAGSGTGNLDLSSSPENNDEQHHDAENNDPDHGRGESASLTSNDDFHPLQTPSEDDADSDIAVFGSGSDDYPGDDDDTSSSVQTMSSQSTTESYQTTPTTLAYVTVRMEIELDLPHLDRRLIYPRLPELISGALRLAASLRRRAERSFSPTQSTSSSLSSGLCVEDDIDPGSARSSCESERRDGGDLDRSPVASLPAPAHVSGERIIDIEADEDELVFLDLLSRSDEEASGVSCGSSSCACVDTGD